MDWFGLIAIGAIVLGAGTLGFLLGMEYQRTLIQRSWRENTERVRAFREAATRGRNRPEA